MTIDLRDLFPSNEGLEKKFVDALLKAIKSNAVKEFDYIKFKQSIISLADLKIDEMTSIKSAFATASTMGVTKSNLIRSAKHYRNILEKEKMQFADAMQNQMNERVAKKKEEAGILQDKLKEYTIKIEQMKKEMEVFQKKIDNVDDEIAEAKEKINQTSNNFMNAYNQFVKTIDQDIDLMNEYL